MNDDGHGYGGCVRAYNALADASATVTAHLKRELDNRFALGISEFDALLALQEQHDQGLPLSQLISRLRLSQPAVSRLIDRLERRGLIRRLDTEDDRRSVLVQLTADGQKLLQEAIPVHAQCIRDALLDRLSSEERDALKAILLKISR